MLENIGNQIAKFSYKTDRIIHSYILTEQTQHISNLLDKYEDHTCKPEKSHYENFFVVQPRDTTSFKTQHVCDNWFYDANTKTHYLVELKAGGDLDNKKNKLNRNRDYWVGKIEENMQRDKRVDKELVSLGWQPVHFWTKEVIKNLDECVDSIERLVLNDSDSHHN